MHKTDIEKISRATFLPILPRRVVAFCKADILSGLCLLILWLSLPAHADKHRRKEDYGLGFVTEIQAPQSEVIEAVEAVADDSIIEGSKEYNKDRYIEKAVAATTSDAFPEWKEPGKVFYKVRSEALDPRGFYESNDVGTLTVRYVVQAKDAATSVLKIDAIFVEDFKHKAHPSDGSVESAEYKAVQDHIDTLEAQKKQDADAEKHRQQVLAQRALEQRAQVQETEALISAGSGLSLEERVRQLRRKAERRVTASGGQLRSAPFKSASAIKSLEAGAEVVIVVQTPYWYGIETEDGEHGWINHSQLESLP
jgi:hypothetical protein